MGADLGNLKGRPGWWEMLKRKSWGPDLHRVWGPVESLNLHWETETGAHLRVLSTFHLCPNRPSVFSQLLESVQPGMLYVQGLPRTEQDRTGSICLLPAVRDSSEQRSKVSMSSFSCLRPGQSRARGHLVKDWPSVREKPKPPPVHLWSDWAVTTRCQSTGLS